MPPRSRCPSAPTYTEAVIAESCERQHIAPDQLIVHADRGPSTTSQSVALLLATLGVVPRTSGPTSPGAPILCRADGWLSRNRAFSLCVCGPVARLISASRRLGRGGQPLTSDTKCSARCLRIVDNLRRADQRRGRVDQDRLRAKSRLHLRRRVRAVGQAGRRRPRPGHRPRARHHDVAAGSSTSGRAEGSAPRGCRWPARPAARTRPGRFACVV